MAVSRANAIIGQDIDLEILFKKNGAPFDPFEVRQVEFLAPDSITVIQTIPSGAITQIATGLYRVTVSGVAIPDTYFDKWYWTPQSSFIEQIQVQSVIVFQISPSGVDVVDDLINDIRTDIDDESETKITDVSLKVIIGKAVKHLNRKLNLKETEDEIMYDGFQFTEAIDDCIYSLLLLQSECLVQKRFFSGSVGKGIKVTQGRTSIDTTAGFSGHAQIIGGTGGVCSELDKAVQDYKLNQAGPGIHGKAIY